MNIVTERTIDLGNNETVKIGIFKDGDGWLVLTPTKSVTYKTFKGALKGAKRLGVIKSHLKSERNF